MPRWITPFVKQCFVASGPSLNMAGSTLLLAYPSGMVLQLKRPDSEIQIDKSDESWIAAAPPVASLLGCILTAISMWIYGRRMTQIIIIVTLNVGWLIIDLAHSVPVILIGRVFHGIAMGNLYLSPILAAEYVSPKHRGSLLMFTGVVSALYVFTVHTTSLYMDWRDNAVMCSAIALVNLPIAILSPESPSWLATQQRYEECRRAFRWLRGDGEEDELNNMIKANELSHQLDNDKPKTEGAIKKTLIELKLTMKTKAFYKPLLIMMHVYTTGQWSGSNLFSPYVFDLLENIAGVGYNDHVMGINVNRVLGAVLAVYVIAKTKRRTMFFSFSFANVAVLLLTAVYTYTKSKGIVPEYPVIGLILLHMHIFFITTCTLPVPYVIAGEIFPLKYKSIAGGSAILLGCINGFVVVKTFPYLLRSVGIHGTYLLYSVIILYGLIIAFIYLPETKGKTLQQIEEEFVGKPLNLEELKSVQTLINKPDFERSS